MVSIYLQCSLTLTYNFTSVNHIPTITDKNQFEHFTMRFAFTLRFLNNSFKNIMPTYTANVPFFPLVTVLAIYDHFFYRR